MRLTLTILLFGFKGFAATYYVSNTGSDAANGITTGTAWQTIAKVNATAFAPGDFILFKSGDTWNEKLVPSTSGTAGSVITYGTYGTGAAPVITGFQSVTGWTNAGGNIWQATFSNSVRYQNTVYIDGEIRAKGRYPNLNPTVPQNSWLIIDSSAADKTKVYGKLSGTPNYTGGEIVIRNNHWTLDHYPITAQTGGQISVGVDPKTGLPWYYGLPNGNGYFIQNHVAVLDTLHEWAYDTTSKVISLYSLSTPTGVFASAIDTLVHIKKKNYLTFDGLRLEGGNEAGYVVDSSNNVTITNNAIQDIGGNGVWCGKTPYFTFTNNSLLRIFNNGLQSELEWYGLNNNGSILNNNFFNIGYKHGMGFNRFATYTALYWIGDFAQVKNNYLDSIGYVPIFFIGDSILVKHNLVSRYCFVKDDGGGIYTWMGGGDKPLGGVIRANIVLNGLTASDGNAENSAATSGIYLDNETNYVTVDSNLVYNMPYNGIFLHLVSNVQVRNNLLVSSKQQLEQLYQDNITFTGNQMYSTTFPLVGTKGFAGFVSMDSNYYLNRNADTGKVVNQFGWYSLSGWQALTGFEVNGKRLPDGITAAAPMLQYNTTMVPVTIPLEGTYINGKGVTYINRITLQPFQSSLLFKAITDLPEPTGNGRRLSDKIKIKLKR